MEPFVQATAQISSHLANGTSKTERETPAEITIVHAYTGQLRVTRCVGSPGEAAF